MFENIEFVAPWISEVVDFKVSAWSLLCLFVGYLLTRLGRARRERRRRTKGIAYFIPCGGEIPTEVIKTPCVYLLAEKPVPSPVFKPQDEQEVDRVRGVGAVRLSATGELLHGSFLVGKPSGVLTSLLWMMSPFPCYRLWEFVTARGAETWMLVAAIAGVMMVTYWLTVILKRFDLNWNFRRGSLIFAEQPLSELQVRAIGKEGFTDPQPAGTPRKGPLWNAIQAWYF